MSLRFHQALPGNDRDHNDNMATIEILVGSMLGAAEYVADELADALTEAGHLARVQNPAELAGLLAEPDAIWLVCTSTHGAGEIPDNLQPFAHQLASDKPDLTGRRYGVVTLGNSDYDTFCQAGKTLDRQLMDLGASRIGAPLEIDVSQIPVPEEAALAWLEHWKKQI